jgi:hypothetical protein
LNFNIKYYLCWGDIPVMAGRYTLPSGRQEIVNYEFHATVDREAWAEKQCETMNSIYGEATHWIETDSD